MIMNGRGVGGGIDGGCRFPFTASQWQELEHQALIFKYMISGVPIPPDLLYSIRRSLDAKLFALPTASSASHIGWKCFEMGVGRKIDPEPGRCRRTDGKKWRCSKEAFQDSKYCEKHMHRGKNRSRKPVETSTTTTTTPHLLTSMLKPTQQQQQQNSIITHSSLSSSLTSDNHNHHLLYPPYHPYHNSKIDSTQTHTHLGLHSGPHHRSNNNIHGSVDEQSFFNETVKGSSMEDSWQLTPLTMSSSRNSYPYLQQIQVQDSSSSKLEQSHHQMYESSEYEQMSRHGEPTVYRFLEERPPENKDTSSSWLNLDDKSTSSSTTQLSMSIPASTSHHVFPIFNSRPQHDEQF
ncbi:unnamed protein product [Rhodiola kirilowii]